MNYNQNSRIAQVTESTLTVGVDIGSTIHFARAFSWRGIEFGKVFKFSNTREGFVSFKEWIELLYECNGKKERRSIVKNLIWVLVNTSDGGNNMAWVSGTFSCGHEGSTNIYGPTKNRDFIAKNRFLGPCPECYMKKLEEDRNKENAESAKKAGEMGLPELTGSVKQIAWANTIRIKIINDIQEYIDRQGDNSRKILSEALDYLISSHIKASWFIENDLPNIKAMLKDYSEHFKEQQQINKISDIRKDATVFPVNKISDIPTEIIVTDDKVSMKSEKNGEIIRIVKALNYSWSGDAWEKKYMKQPVLPVKELLN